MQLTLDSVRYETLVQPFVGDLKPYHHQAQTLALIEEALARRETLCLLNTSITGSGKTLANFAHAILHGTWSIGVYPTNELIADQEHALRKYVREDDVIKVDSATLDYWQDRMQVRGHTQTLQPIVAAWEKRALLTNPDILYLMMYDLYGYSYKVGYRERIFQAIVNAYPIIAFDEFHLYNAKQVGNVAFIVGTIARLAPDKPHIFIFSSATPRETREWVDKLRLRVEDVTALPSECGRIVSEPVELTLVPANLSRWEALETVETKVLGQVQDFAKQVGVRGVFILDGVYDAKVLAKNLTDLYGVDAVGEIHGYMPKDARVGNLERRFTVGTTTIDVGVDLTGNKAKEFIVFEAKTGEQFIQRIGRIGRQGREPKEIPIPNRAWGLVPHYVYNFVAEQIQKRQIDTTRPLPRREILDLVASAYTQKEDFQRYVSIYSPYEAAAAKHRILGAYLSATRDTVQEKIRRVIGELYRNMRPDATSDEVARIIGGVEVSQRALWQQYGDVIQRTGSDGKIHEDWYLNDLETFRGSGEFQVALYDTLDETQGWFPFKIYNLPFALRRAVFTEMNQDKFETLVEKKTGERAMPFLRQVERAQPLGYLRIDGLESGKPIPFWFIYEETGLLGSCEQLIRLEGWKIALDALRSLKLINRELSKRKLIAWVVQMDPFDLMHEYNLPAMFQLYRLRPIGLNGRSTIGDNFWTVAFGLNAFLLSSVAKRSNSPYII